MLQHKIQNTQDLRKEKRTELSKAIQNYLRIHRKNLLPQYAVFFDGFAQQLESTAPSIISLEKTTLELEVLYEKTMNAAVGPTTEFLSGFSAEDIERTRKSYEKEFRKSMKEAKKTSKQKKKRYARLENFSEFFLGLLKPEQKKTLALYSNSFPDDFSERWFSHQYRRRMELVRLLSNRESVALQNYIEQWLSRPKSLLSEEEKALFEHIRRRGIEASLQILKTADANQIKRMIQRLRDLSKDCRDLSR